MHVASPPDFASVQPGFIQSDDSISIDVESVAIAFRLNQPENRFHLIEERLKRRDPNKFTAYAEKRASAEALCPLDSIESKISKAINGSEFLQAERQVLYSTELEVLMDLVYPIASTKRLYDLAFSQGKQIVFRSAFPTSKLFVFSLLKKCGYERFTDLKVFQPTELQLKTDAFSARPKYKLSECFPNPTNLASNISSGLFEQFLDSESIVDTADDEAIARMIGFQLIGPSIVCLLQAVGQMNDTCRFIEIGNGFLSTMCQTLRHSWPWLPEAKNNDHSKTIGLRSVSADISLLPIKPNGRSYESIFPIHHFEPDYLLLPAIDQWFQMAFKGSLAPVFQQGIEKYIRTFADASRGLFLPLPPDYIISSWKAFILRPNPSTLETIAKSRLFPDLLPHLSPLANLKALKSGPWPTATYLLSTPKRKKISQFLAPARCNKIISLSL